MTNSAQVPGIATSHEEEALGKDARVPPSLQGLSADPRNFRDCTRRTVKAPRFAATPQSRTETLTASFASSEVAQHMRLSPAVPDRALRVLARTAGVESLGRVRFVDRTIADPTCHCGADSELPRALRKPPGEPVGSESAALSADSETRYEVLRPTVLSERPSEGYSAAMRTRIHMLPILDRALAQLARDVRERFGENVISIRLFGSYARAAAHEESDVDIAVVLRKAGRNERAAVIDLAADIGLDTGLLLSPTVFDRRTYDAWREQDRPLVRDIEREGIRF